MNAVLQWFTRDRGWTPFGFQQEVWSACLAGESGLIHAPTGMGKTYAAWLGPLMQWIAMGEESTPPLTVLWITPLRALALDTAHSLQLPVAEMNLPWTVQLRTGDVSASVKAKQKQRLPSALVTTPESLSLLLSYPDARERFSHLRCVVVDEWHELMSTKRGTQTELGLARLRAWNPGVQTWGMSATLGNLEQARDVLMGAGAEGSRLIVADDPKAVTVETLAPDDIERFPWAGHLGITLLDRVIERVEAARSTLLFTNTRSQSEIWFARLQSARPDWIGAIALHHGSIDRDIREQVERLLRDGRLKCVVCTSSLDLGVDFSPVDQVLQVGSPKGVARLMQRAGRSGHQPGAVSRVVGVPAHAFELIEFAAAREAAEARDVESRLPLSKPLDVLVQHLVTCAIGGGFREQDLLAEVRTSHAYRDLGDAEWRWCMDFVERGGASLTAYPQFSRIVRDASGNCVVASPQVARMHRMQIGTITGSTSVNVRFQRGRTLGTVEESFVARLRAGDRFVFAGHVVEFIRVRDMTAEVRKATRKGGTFPVWAGGKSPLSTQLAAGVRRKIGQALAGVYDAPEMRVVRPLLELQRRWSTIPASEELLLEVIETREGVHHFLYPFQGRLVHEGMGALAAHRLSSQAPRSITVNANDYGFELLTDEPLELAADEWMQVFTSDELLDDLLACVNASELARRQFRDIARVAGLISQGFPGEKRMSRHLQASSELFFDVFAQFDPGNLLLDQARREVLEQQLEYRRMRAALLKMERMKLVRRSPHRLTPLSFPLWAESLREQHVTSEAWEDRVRRMAVSLEKAAADR
jgi:ATP-dependent Lhr-like helicase